MIDTTQSMFAWRPMTSADADQVAWIHAQSWRSAYRGILPGRYLDHEIENERRTYWRGRLADTTDRDYGAIAFLDGESAGFVFGIADHSPEWGHLLDNLHMLPAMRGHGGGRVLLRAFAEALTRERKDQGLHLWVYDANRDAIRFYDQLGATWRHCEMTDTNGGGRASISLYTWASTAAMLQGLADVPIGTP